MRNKTVTCLFCQAKVPVSVGCVISGKYEEHHQDWHNITVYEEVERVIERSRQMSATKVEDLDDSIVIDKDGNPIDKTILTSSTSHRNIPSTGEKTENTAANVSSCLEVVHSNLPIEATSRNKRRKKSTGFNDNEQIPIKERAPRGN
jgi:hypothetical protein